MAGEGQPRDLQREAKLRAPLDDQGSKLLKRFDQRYHPYSQIAEGVLNEVAAEMPHAEWDPQEILRIQAERAAREQQQREDRRIIDDVFRKLDSGR